MVNIIIYREEEYIWQKLSWPIAVYSPDMQWTDCARTEDLHSVQSIQQSDLNSISVQSNPDALLFEPICSLWPVYMHGVVFTQKNIYKFQMGILIHVLCIFYYFCTMTNKCTVISQIITLLQVLTLSCHPQGACNQCLAKLHKYFNAGVGNTVYN
jgi:hypothetical protein